MRRSCNCCRAKDDATWEEVYDRLSPRLLAYAGRRIGADESHDVVGETMRRAVAGVDRFDPAIATIDAWIFGICHHVVLDAQRAALTAWRHAPARPAGRHADPVDVVVREEERGTVRDTFARLRDSDRELLELRVVGALTSEEVAAVLGKRAGAVRTAQTRALAACGNSSTRQRSSNEVRARHRCRPRAARPRRAGTAPAARPSAAPGHRGRTDGDRARSVPRDRRAHPAR